MNQAKNKLNAILIGLVLLGACRPDRSPLFEIGIQDHEVKLIKLIPDHEMLLPDGIAKMEFTFKAYGIKDVKALKKTVAGEVVTYSEETRTDTFLIPNDRLSPGFIKTYHKNGTLLADNIYSTTNTNEPSYEFYAQGGSVKSDPVTIAIRPLPAAQQVQEIVFPVVFHLLVPPASNRPSYSITTEQLQEKLDYINKVYNREITTNPNGGTAKIKFRLAEYDEAGKLLAEKGKTITNVAANLTQAQYTTVINGKIWDLKKYVNIYVCKFTDSWSSSGALSYVAEAPKVIMANEAAIPGLTAAAVQSYSKADVTDFSQVGIMLNFGEFFNPTQWDTHNALELSTIFGYFLGLKSPEYTNAASIVNGDNDYCPDTYVYQNNTINFNIRKTEYFDKKNFTSFDIMSRYSRKNSVTVDQAARIRTVIERCPSRWSYKSNWAFTGK